MDGAFKEEDRLVVERSVNFNMDAPDTIDNFEVLKVKIPDDGADEHQIRFRIINDKAAFTTLLPSVFKGQHVLYLEQGDERIPLEKNGTMGGYSTYEISGNEFTISVGISNGKRGIKLMLLIAIAILILIIVMIIVIIVNIRKHGRRLPKAVNKIKTSVSEKIESKEQLFYNDSQDNMVKKEANDNSDKKGKRKNKRSKKSKK